MAEAAGWATVTGVTEWCADGILGPQTAEWWAGNVMDGHAFCRMEAEWFDDYHVNCCGNDDNRRAKACTCACHAPKAGPRGEGDRG